MKFSTKGFFIIIVFIFNSLLTPAQSNTNDKPRLVVGIMVDGLQQIHLDLLWNNFDEAGFKRIVNQGALLKNMSYNMVSAGKSSDIATIMTGSVPYYHGVGGDNVYNRKKGKIQSVLFDDQQIGIGTKETLSAHNLLASTVLDEMMLTYPSKSKSYVVAINAEEAIMMGGHTANNVTWLDDVYLKWITTGYYKEGLSRWADDMNLNGTFKQFASRNWEPMNALKTYLSYQKDSKYSGFKIDPSDKRNKNTSVSLLKTTPSANSLVADLGIRILQGEDLGSDNYPDMLILQFTVRTPNEKMFARPTIEKEDIYLRLDKEIQYLLHKIDSKVGLDKTVVFMFGNQIEIHSPYELGENKIPAGYFNASRSMSLVNSYLMAIYGHEAWIEGYYGKNIFLNKAKIEEKKLNFKEIQQTVAEFMLEFDGIQAAFSSNQVLSLGGSASSEMARLRNSTHKNSVGDVIITLLPGWLEMDDAMNPVGESNAIVSYAPFYFFGWKIKPQTITTSYQVTDIAPTLARIMNIPMPNACIGKPIVEIAE